MRTLIILISVGIGLAILVYWLQRQTQSTTTPPPTVLKMYDRNTHIITSSEMEMPVLSMGSFASINTDAPPVVPSSIPVVINPTGPFVPSDLGDITSSGVVSKPKGCYADNKESPAMGQPINLPFDKCMEHAKTYRYQYFAVQDKKQGNITIPACYTTDSFEKATQYGPSNQCKINTWGVKSNIGLDSAIFVYENELKPLAM